MLTTLGKVFTFMCVILGVSSLGVAIYTFADETNYGDQEKAIVAETKEAMLRQEQELMALGEVLDELVKGGRPIAFNPDDPLNADAKPKSVSETKKDLSTLQGEIDREINQRNQLQVEVASLLSELDRLRGQTREELKTQKELREQIRPDAAGARAFSDLIADAKVAKEEAQRRKDAMHPLLVAEVMRLMALMRQHETLTAREKEIKGGN
jgi:chromosome segregation ATPase